MARVFFDTNLFIYLLENVGENSSRTHNLLARMTERKDQLLTSTMTLGEILVKPMRLGKREWAKQYEELFQGPGMVLIPFDRDCAELYAQIRIDEGIKPPDAIQLSCAAHAHADLFITNDARLSRKSVPGIHFITSLDRALI
jgi:predicted nucleic acid-binding protein